ncbi:ABC-type lipoprotein export system ATPase subunit [Clostridium beijerinckii]|nr:ABC-type lipoprotein export system ATPase subunit [Clostridium beijerinckii]
MSILSLKNISKYYKVKSSEKVYVLKDINLSFDKKELVAIIGESGSGKSTLMNLIGGLDSKYNGELFVNGENIKKFKKRELDEYRKNRIGFVFQSFNLIPHLSILNNVAIAMTLSNVKKKKELNVQKNC